jgi:hypothetical protein
MGSERFWQEAAPFMLLFVISDGENPIESVPRLVERLYEVVAELERLFLGRHFTPDGHLVGSIGEVLAASRYGLELLPSSTQSHDARTSNGTLVQIKATQGRSVGLRGEPQHLIVLHLTTRGSVTEVYNGPGALAWSAAGKRQSNGQRPITLHKLRLLMKQVPSRLRIDEVETSTAGPRRS